MFELKTLSPEAVPRALAKAERYRLLNEPGEAESICLDALADRSRTTRKPSRCSSWPSPISSTTIRRASATREDGRPPDGEYERAYYAGIIFERRAKACCSTASRAAARAPTSGFARRWPGTNGPKRSARPTTTTRCCDGTPALA